MMEASAIKRVIVTIVAVTVAAVMIFAIANLDNWFTEPWNGDDGTRSGTIYIDGAGYNPKTQTSYLLIVTDRLPGGIKLDGSPKDECVQADIVALITFDHDAKEYRMLHLDRDTVAEINRPTETGADQGMNTETLSMMTRYGDGTHITAKSAMSSVSRLMYGMSIERYIMTDMDTFIALANRFSDVELTVEHDLSHRDPRLSVGAEVSFGKDAELLRAFLSADGVPANNSGARAQRVRAYLDALMLDMEEMSPENSYIDGIYTEYENGAVTTDCHLSGLHGFFSYVRDYSYKGVISPEGMYTDRAAIDEYNMDKESLESILKAYYYDEIK